MREVHQAILEASRSVDPCTDLVRDGQHQTELPHDSVQKPRCPDRRPSDLGRRAPERAIWQAVPCYPRVPFDLTSYERRTRDDSRQGSCFICSIVAGDLDGHFVINRDDVCVAFLAKWPTLVGYTLLAPLEHRTQVVSDFTQDEHAELQRRVHRLGRAVSAAVPTERLYVLALGSNTGNAHVHWHIAPLPPGVPYEQQQYAALMVRESGYLAIPESDQAALAQRIAELMAANP
jgi:diadenosine tetraphosphate (Ap4A) HIT family hydrolase